MPFFSAPTIDFNSAPLLAYPFPEESGLPKTKDHIYPSFWEFSRRLLQEPSSSGNEETKSSQKSSTESFGNLREPPSNATESSGNLSVPPSSTTESSGNSSVPSSNATNCTTPAIEQFPRPLLSLKARQNGGLILHVLATIYLFVAIAIVCDEFFVPSLEMICDRKYHKLFFWHIFLFTSFWVRYSKIWDLSKDFVKRKPRFNFAFMRSSYLLCTVLTLWMYSLTTQHFKF